MFADAYRIASCFTLPVVISSRDASGVCRSSIGACVVVNRDGWILTTAHIIEEIRRQQQSAALHGAYGGEVRAHERDATADKKFRHGKVRTLHRPTGDTIVNHSVWWGRDGALLREAQVRPGADLALGRLQPFDASGIAQFPVFKKPGADYRPGRSLCKLGFPFHGITPSFDEAKNAFLLPPGAVPLPLFPSEGIFTRMVVAHAPGVDAHAHAGKKRARGKRGSNGNGNSNSDTGNGNTAMPQIEAGKFIETSTPGLTGQSGGPVVDVRGNVWALQSHTRHYPLGFSPPAPGQNGGAQKEHQFLNVGLGVHAESILHFLQSAGVEHQSVE